MPKPANQQYVPSLRFHWLTSCCDAVARTTTRERRFKQALIQRARRYTIVLPDRTAPRQRPRKAPG